MTEKPRPTEKSSVAEEPSMTGMPGSSTPERSTRRATRPVFDVLDRRALRKVLGAFATGVTVVTVGDDVVPHGMTANSFASVSLDPPLVLVCVSRDAVMHRILGAAPCFGVSVLAGDQEAVARHFANQRRVLGAAQFDAVDWLPGPLTGVPLIGGALAGFECEVWRRYDGGDHTIVVGRLLALDRRTTDDDVLVFFDGQFRHLGRDRSGVTA